jgi:tetratricopeptide (TPR) repeat protein
MTGRTLQTSRYSPGNLAPDVLERLFVGRSELLKELVAKVSRSVLTKDKHHMLLVGPRGAGKTHVMALLHQRLTTDPGLAEAREKSVIAYLNEEEWGVASFLDFVLVILRSIQPDHDEVAARILLVEETFERDPEKARESAEDTLLQVAKNKTLVLLCENLNDLFEGLGPEGQRRWRSLVQESRCWCIVATAPSLFLDVSRQTEPFYGFFTIRNLEALSLEDAIELLRRKAELEGRHDLAAAIDTAIGRTRVRAIYHIAGGSHRAYIVLSEFLTSESLDELVGPFMNMVDDLTPYYQERMRNLTSPLQRKLVDYLCRQRKPATVKDVARATLVQPQSAAKQLGELAKAGLVQKTPRGRESFYELAEPLMRICIEVKDKRTEYVRTFVDLLRHWFSYRELEIRYRDYGSRLSSLEHVHLRAALEDGQDKKTDPFLDALRLEVLRCEKEGDLKGVIEAAGRRADELGEPHDYASTILAAWELADYTAVERYALEGLKRYPEDSITRLMLAGSLYMQDKYEPALLHLDEVVKREPQRIDARALRGHALYDLGRYREFVANDDELVDIDPDRRRIHDGDGYSRALAHALSEIGRLDEALEVSKNLIAKQSGSVANLRMYLHIAMARGSFPDAEEAVRQFKRLPNYDSLELSLFEVMLKGAQGRWREAIAISEEAVGQHRTADALFANAWASLSAGASLSSQQEVALVKAASEVSSLWLLSVILVLRMVGHDKLREAVVSRSKSRVNESSDLLYERALVLLDQGKLDDVGRLAEGLAMLGAGVQSRTLGLLAKAAQMGMSSIVEDLARDSDGSDEPLVREVLGVGLWIELQRRGPASFAEQFLMLREGLSGSGEGLLAEALLASLRRLIRTRSPACRSSEWESALARMASHGSGLEASLQLFSVGVRYAATDDESVLLELPLEQRKLLTSEFGRSS